MSVGSVVRAIYPSSGIQDVSKLIVPVGPTRRSGRGDEPGGSASAVARFLADVGDEIPAQNFRDYIDEVRDLVPENTFEDLEEAYRHLTVAQASVRKAVEGLAR